MQSFSRSLAAVAAAFSVLPLLAVAPVESAELRSQPRAVLELFTSQGCKSCPKADEYLTELGERKDLITLAYHVDYWDYVGWKDTFGSPENSQRQRDYSKLWGQTGVFTPQLVVNGSMGVRATRQGEVSTAIGSARLDVPVTLTLNGDMLEVTVGSKPDGGEAIVWLVTYTANAEVDITSGENAGKTIDYTDIVTGKQVLGMWSPTGGATFRLPVSELLGDGSDGAVVLVQRESKGLPGAIIGAASVEL
jgi:hypothetical protein